MVRTSGRGGVAIVAAVAILYGSLTILGSAVGFAAGAGTALDTVVLFVQSVLAVLLLPAGVGMLRGQRWGQLLGIVAFYGIPVVQLLPMAVGAAISAPFLGIIVATSCGLYLTLASEEFDGGGGRVVVDEDEEDGYVSNPLR